jgi:uncharacterized protein YjbI with pentapeptide repeats
MANQDHLDILLQGVDTWNRWRETKRELIPNLEGAELSEKNLNGVNLSRANLREANLYDTHLIGANLSEADLFRAGLDESKLSGATLRGANLSEAHLSWWDLGGSPTDLSAADLSAANLIGADLRKANLSWANLRKANLEKANLSEANLSGTILVETNFVGANLSRSRIYGVSAWNVKLNEKTNQGNLIITENNEPTVMVDDLEVAQFVYLLLHHEKLRHVINVVTDKGVLLLGRFGGGGIEVLRAIAERLRDMGYLPIIFDFERPRDRNYTETVKTLVGLSRFVIVDLSGPSVPQELYATVPHFKLPFVPILEMGHREHAMFVDLLENQNVLRPIVAFENQAQLLPRLPEEIVAPAEAYVAERQALLAELFGRDR